MKKIKSYPNVPMTLYEMKERFKDNLYLNSISFDYDIPKLKANTFSVILMKDEKENSGHYVSVVCNSKQAYYFDAFGCMPDEVVLKRMKEFSDECFYISDILQDINSSRCAIYTIKFIEFWLKGYTMKSILSKMKKISEVKNMEW